MVDALRTIAALLRKYAPRRAPEVEDLLRAAATEDPNLDLDVCGDVLWGPSGLWDSGPQVLQRPHHDPAVCRSDELTYRGAFVALAGSIAERDLGTPAQRARIDEIVATFRQWERDGL